MLDKTRVSLRRIDVVDWMKRVQYEYMTTTIQRHARVLTGSSAQFTISFENANVEYWMTEKLFGTLAAGSIPSA